MATYPHGTSPSRCCLGVLCLGVLYFKFKHSSYGVYSSLFIVVCIVRLLDGRTRLRICNMRSMALMPCDATGHVDWGDNFPYLI